MGNIYMRLTDARKALSMTQKQLAQGSKMGLRTYCRYESGEGKRDLPSSLLMYLAQNDINMNWLLTGEGEMFQHTVPPIEPAASPLPNDIGEAVELMQEMSTFERRLFLALLRMKRDEVAEGTDRAAKKAVNKRVEVGSPQIT